MLFQNQPNPLLGTGTMIAYRTAGGRGFLRIFDSSGRQVRLLWEGSVSPGMKSVYWDGRDDSGTPVQSGVYFYRLAAGGTTLSKKMIVLH